MKSARLVRIAAAACLAVVVTLHSSGLAAGDKDNSQKESESQIVKNILKVEYKVQKSYPPNLVVTAIGEVPTGGFDKVKLVRATYATPPKDGIQDYTLFAEPPSGPAIQVISQVEATDRWKGYNKEAPWIKGIRVHGVDGGVVVKMFPKPK